MLIAALAAAEAAAGDEAPRSLMDLTLAELAEVKVVSVSRRPEELFRTPAAVTVVPREEIQRSGARTLPELLRRVPGVDVARVDASQWAVGIRGFTSTLSRAQLVLVDGRSVYSPLFAGTYWDVQDLVLEDVERVEVIRGPGGSLWGANAVNGVVNVITSAAADRAGGYLAVGAGTEERLFVDARYGGTLRDAHWAAWAKVFTRDEQHRVGGSFDDTRMSRAGLRADWDRGAAGLVTLAAVGYAGEAGRRTTVASYERPFASVLERDESLSGAYVRSRWFKAREGGSLSLQAWYDHTQRDGVTFREDRDTVDLDGQVHASVGGRHAVVTGFAYRFSASRTGGVPTVAFVPASRGDHSYGAFVEDTVAAAASRLRLTVGTKVEHNVYTGLEWQPSARLGFAPRDGQQVWAAVSRTVRTPSRVDRDLELTAALSADEPSFVRVLGSADFVSERAIVYEAGFRVRAGDRLRLDAAAFHNRYPNLTSLEPGTPFREGERSILPRVIGNGTDARLRGLEIAADVRVAARWLVRAGYAHLDADIRALPGSRDTTSASATGTVPRHAFTFWSSATLPASVEADVFWRHAGERPSRRVPAYSEMDVRLSRRCGRHLELALSGRDLLAPRHDEFGGPVAIERSLYGEARWRW